MLTPKENVLEVLNWGNPEYIPMTPESVAILGFGPTEMAECPISGPGLDPFGLKWDFTFMGTIPNSSTFMFDDITEWKKYVKFPDVDKMDFTAAAEVELGMVNRDEKIVAYYHPTGIFERLAAFMGFENALISMLTEPEACHEFFDAFTDYKIKVANKVIDAYQPELYVYFDDIANARSTFMSPEVYRELLKPYHKRFADAINGRGVIFSMHTCGRCEDILQDYVEIGVKHWHSAQVMNDIPAIQERYKGILTIEGGWDSSGKPGYVNATTEDIVGELRRCVNEYGKNGGYIIMPLFYSEKGNALMIGDPRLDAATEEWMRTRSLK